MLKQIQEAARFGRGVGAHSSSPKGISSHAKYWGWGNRGVCYRHEFKDWLRNLPKVLVCKDPSGPVKTEAGPRCWRWKGLPNQAEREHHSLPSAVDTGGVPGGWSVTLSSCQSRM